MAKVKRFTRIGIMRYLSLHTTYSAVARRKILFSLKSRIHGG